MVKYSEDEDRIHLPDGEQHADMKYNAGNIDTETAEKLKACGIYVDSRCIINEYSEIIPPLLGLTEIAAKIGWDKRKAAVYAKRGVLPEPSVYTGGRPCWTAKQIEEWMSNPKNKKFLD